MMNIFPNKLTLNGETRTIQGILNSDNEIADFLREWYDSRDFITVNTSGSTGTPKAIQLKKTFVAESAKRTINFFNLRANDRILLCLPTRFIAGKLMIVRALLGELDLCTMPADSNFSALKKHQVKPLRFVAMVANQVVKLLDNPNIFNNIEALLIGGSALPQSLENALQNVPSACFVSYGMTETATHIALRAINGETHDDCYHCLDGVSVSLVEDCLSIDLPDGTHFKTNDIGELRDNKTFRILGRADNVIISGGIKFFPEMIEAKLSTHILEAFYITSQVDEILGSKMALVIEKTETKTIKKELQCLFAQQLPRYERPKAIIFQSRLLRTQTGKLIRN